MKKERKKDRKIDRSGIQLMSQIVCKRKEPVDLSSESEMSKKEAVRRRIEKESEKT